MLKIKNKIMLLSLLGFLGLSSSGCGKNNDNNIPSTSCETVTETNEIYYSQEQTEDNNVEEETIEEEIEEIIEEIKAEKVSMVTSLKDASILETVDGKKIGTLPSGSSLMMLEHLTNGWYAVEYYGNPAFINGSYLTESDGYELFSDIENVYYNQEAIELTIPDYISEISQEEKIIVPKNQCVEVYQEFDDYYLVKAYEHIGYIAKNNLEMLTGNFAVVDISRQMVTVYSDNEIVLTSPVVTGMPGENQSDLGVFNIYEITYQRPLKGPDYSSYVDVMLKYNGGEGLHDAEYHSCTDKLGKPKDHGWRSIEKFGGKTYLIDGSHGCINMPHEAAMAADKVLKLKDTVLVQE